MKSQKYARPPVQEAVFDLRIQGGKPFQVNLFKPAAQTASGYTYKDILRNVNIADQTDSSDIQKSVEEIGCRYISDNGKQIAVFARHGFSFSRLAVYDGWDKNFNEAMRLWNVYCDIIKPQAVVRAAVRFINKFRIPQPLAKPEEYFNTYPQYENSLSPTWRQLSCKLLLPHKGGILSHIVFDACINHNSNNTEVLLDIDVFSDNAALSPEDSDSLKNTFNQIREIKNNVFEKSVTEKARELIE